MFSLSRVIIESVRLQFYSKLMSRYIKTERVARELQQQLSKCGSNWDGANLIGYETY